MAQVRVQRRIAAILAAAVAFSCKRGDALRPALANLQGGWIRRVLQRPREVSWARRVVIIVACRDTSSQKGDSSSALCSASWELFSRSPAVGVGLDLEGNVGFEWLFLLRSPVELLPGVVVVDTGMEAALRLRSLAGARSVGRRSRQDEQMEAVMAALSACSPGATLHRRGVRP